MLSHRSFFVSQLVVLLCAGGCGGHAEHRDRIEPEDRRDAGSLDERDSGSILSDASSRPAECRRTPGHFAQFLFTLSTKPFPAKPILMVAFSEISWDGSMQVTLQFVDNSRRSLVGAPLFAGTFPVQADGAFRIGPLHLDIPAEANCALADTAMALEVTLEGGQLCDDSTFACGLMNGTVLGLGIDLNGSTFTAQRFDNNAFPEPVLNCERVGAAESCR